MTREALSSLARRSGLIELCFTCCMTPEGKWGVELPLARLLVSNRVAAVHMVGCLFAISRAQVCPMTSNWLLIEVCMYGMCSWLFGLLRWWWHKALTRKSSHFHLCSHAIIKAFQFSTYDKVALDLSVPHPALYSPYFVQGLIWICQLLCDTHKLQILGILEM